jgi:hypothetical protein
MTHKVKAIDRQLTPLLQFVLKTKATQPLIIVTVATKLRELVSMLLCTGIKKNYTKCLSLHMSITQCPAHPG